jgi:hypothetical protein
MRRRLVFPASEIRAVIVRCTSCGTEVIPGPDAMTDLRSCPSCGDTWSAPGNAPNADISTALSAIKRLRKANASVELLVEIDAREGGVP